MKHTQNLKSSDEKFIPSSSFIYTPRIRNHKVKNFSFFSKTVILENNSSKDIHRHSCFCLFGALWCMHRSNLKYLEWYSLITHIWKFYCVLDPALGQRGSHLCLCGAYMILEKTDINQISMIISGMNDRHELPLRMLQETYNWVGDKRIF